VVCQEQLMVISGGQEMSSFRWSLEGHNFPTQVHYHQLPNIISH
jgi:hypothetical protein